MLLITHLTLQTLIRENDLPQEKGGKLDNGQVERMKRMMMMKIIQVVEVVVGLVIVAGKLSTLGVG